MSTANHPFWQRSLLCNGGQQNSEANHYQVNGSGFPLCSLFCIAFYPFILVKQKELKQDKVLIHHERIHHRQQLELLILPFYILYGINYLYNLCVYRNHYKPYRQIVFEREAFAMD